MPPRAPPRPGGAALQLDVLDLSSVLDKNADLRDGRLRAALESCMRCAQRPDLEVEAARTPSFGDPRLVHAARVRLALAQGLDPEAAFEAAAEGDDAPPPPPALASTLAADMIPMLLGAGRCELGSQGCRLLAGILPQRVLLKRLVFCDLSSNVATDLGREFGGVALLCDALKDLPHLAFLSLHGNILLAPGCEAVCRMLRGGCKALRYLDLSRCNVGHTGVAELLPAFERTISPRKPRKHRAGEPHSAQPVEGEAKEGEAAAAVGGAGVAAPAAGAPAILAAPAEKELSPEEQAAADFEAALEGRSEEYAAAAAAAAAHAEMMQPPNPHAQSSLVWLDLSENNLCGFGLDAAPAVALASALMQHPALRHLDLSRNRLSRPVVAAIAERIEANAALRSLLLDENGIDAQPAAQLARSLAGNARLHMLSLRYNRLRSDGASAFADLMRRSASLKRLDLRGNYIGELGQRDLRLAMMGLPPPPEVSAFGGDPRAPLYDDGDDGGGCGRGGPGSGGGSGDFRGRGPSEGGDGDTDGFSERPSTAGSVATTAASAGAASDDAEAEGGRFGPRASSSASRTAYGGGGASGGAGDAEEAASPDSGRSRDAGASASTPNPSRPDTAATSTAAAAAAPASLTTALSLSGAGALPPAHGGAEAMDVMSMYAAAAEADEAEEEEGRQAAAAAAAAATRALAEPASKQEAVAAGAVGAPASTQARAPTQAPAQAQAHGSEAVASPSRAVGGGVRAIMALRHGGADESSEEAALFRVEGDGAWCDTKGRRVFVTEPEGEQGERKVGPAEEGKAAEAKDAE